MIEVVVRLFKRMCNRSWNVSERIRLYHSKAPFVISADQRTVKKFP
jgi:hypothetical protein